MELAVPGTHALLRLNPDCGGAVGALTFDVEGQPVSVLCSDSAPTQTDLQHGPGDARPTGLSSCFHPLFAGRFLWPFNDRIPKGRYVFRGRAYQLPPNDPETGDAIHGMLYARPMAAEPDDLAHPEQVRLQDTIHRGECKGYPFDARIAISLQLARASLEISVATSNVGRTQMPVAFGWHPYFMLPDAGSSDELVLRTTADSYVPVDDQLLPTGGARPAAGSTLHRFCSPDGARIDASELDVAVTAANPGITTELMSDRLLLRIEQDGAFSYQQWFTAPDRSSIAIEPITAATDSFNRPELGQCVLSPGESLAGRVRVSVAVRRRDHDLRNA